MNYIIKNASVYTENGFRPLDILISEGGVRVFPSGSDMPLPAETIPVEASGKWVLPGFADVHVHFREPGFSYKETIRTGSEAAVRGGYTTVCTMPNVRPAPSSREGLQAQLDIIRRDAVCHVIPYGAITKEQSGRGTLSDMDELAPDVVAFSDDGKGVQTPELMKEAMQRAKSLGKIIVAHCEDERLLTGGPIHDGTYAAQHGYKGIPSESEWAQVKRDAALAEETGCAYHVCHVSTKESVDIIRRAKASGVDITCETAPHYLTLCDEDLQEDGRFKMNPPLRSSEDRDALIRGIQDGTIDMIATDHAPHSREEKSRGLKGSPFGVVGLETAFPVLYSRLVLPGTITIEKLIDLLALAPRRRFRLPGSLIPDPAGSEITCPREGFDVTLIDPGETFRIDPESFASMGRATPFDGWEVQGRVRMTFVDGAPVFQSNN